MTGEHMAEQLRTALSSEIDGAALTAPEYDAVLADARGRVVRRRSALGASLAVVAVLGVAGAVSLQGPGKGSAAVVVPGVAPSTSAAASTPRPTATSAAPTMPATTGSSMVPDLVTSTSTVPASSTTTPAGPYEAGGYGGVAVVPAPTFTPLEGIYEDAGPLASQVGKGPHWQLLVSGPETTTLADGTTEPAVCFEVSINDTPGYGRTCLPAGPKDAVGSNGVTVDGRRYFFGWMDDARVRGMNLVYATAPLVVGRGFMPDGHGHWFYLASWTADHKPTAVQLLDSTNMTIVHDTALQKAMDERILGFDQWIQH